MTTNDRGRGGVQRVMAKLQNSIENGSYYEAHQMYRTLCFRYTSQKKYTEAINLLHSGAMLLLQHNQHESGSDLGLLLIDTLKNSNLEPTEENTDKIAQLHRELVAENVDTVMLVIKAVKWSCGFIPHSKYGHPLLHKKLAHNCWKGKKYVEARYHFLHSYDGEGCAGMLIEYHITQGYASEVDLFIAQMVLQFLCLHNKTTANVTFLCYTKQHPRVEASPPYVLPLLNFIWFLLLAIDGGKLAVFTILCEQYQPSIDRDPVYKQYLDKIGQVFFGLPPPAKPDRQGGLLGNLLQSVFNDTESDSSDEDVPRNTSVSIPEMDLD